MVPPGGVEGGALLIPESPVEAAAGRLFSWRFNYVVKSEERHYCNPPGQMDVERPLVFRPHDPEAGLL